ncbi:hypothetical protein [Streptomyces neyagawaensis]|uniref:hypothetical protein n=1 Tax=Streptomyces neyagawaensis TaxID=42238 RepID=UPI0006E3B797|nr:hypothetical protein [Streptomyces neyagawaensis]MCL6738592.1 hypothetical protein [Streptomyces neyagawaensis]MDE1681859.1 hypothetical protein [Streptomyces neyagawaensis]
MSSRTRTRAVKTAAGVHTVRIPRQRGRRSDPFVIVVPERPSLTREALGFVGRTLWRFRRALAPTALAVLAWPVTAVLHVIGWWSGLVLAPAALVPALWVLLMQRRRPVSGSVLGWRIGLAVLATLAAAWLALAAGFGPLAGPLALLWLLTLIAAQTTWFFVRPSR